MDPRRFVIATLVGAVVLMGAGFLVFIPFGDFYKYAMNAGSASVAREPMLLWAIGLGALSYSALLTLAIGIGARSWTVAEGMKIGAIVGFLLWFSADFMLFGISTVGSLASTIVDPFLELVPSALSGAAIAVVLSANPFATGSRGATPA
jgi:hypothetical protein